MIFSQSGVTSTSLATLLARPFWTAHSKIEAIFRRKTLTRQAPAIIDFVTAQVLSFGCARWRKLGKVVELDSDAVFSADPVSAAATSDQNFFQLCVRQ